MKSDFLPPFSLIHTNHNYIAVVIYANGSKLLCRIIYVPFRKEYLSIREQHPTIFPSISATQEWYKVSGLSYSNYMKVIREKNICPLNHILGQLVLLESTEVRKYYSSIDAPTLSVYNDVMEELARILGVPLHRVGITGSSLLEKSDPGDIDFVIYGEDYCRIANNKIAYLRKRSTPRIYKGKFYHLCFQSEQIAGYLDPHFVRSKDPLCCQIISQDYSLKKSTPIAPVNIIDDSQSIYFPSQYLLESGKILLSFRFGHCGLFKNGQTICTQTSVPFVTFSHSETQYIVLCKNDYLKIC